MKQDDWRATWTRTPGFVVRFLRSFAAFAAASAKPHQETPLSAQERCQRSACGVHTMREAPPFIISLNASWKSSFAHTHAQALDHAATHSNAIQG